MHFSTLLTVVLSLGTASFAAPLSKRALTVQTFNQFTVSGGVAGNALAEVNAKFPINLNALASVSASDAAIISKAAQISEQAEVATGGFNDAIAAAGGTSSAAGAPLQIGKIKNKVLKLQTDVLRIMIKIAKGDTSAATATQLAAQQKKLNANIALDVAAKGKTSTAISFNGGSD